jgi:flavodoxin
MKIGIFVFSETGHTLQVAEEAEKKLLDQGHNVELQKIEIFGSLENSRVKDISELKNAPEPVGYDGFVFASFVTAFNLNKIMRVYLEGIPEIQGKVCCITTQHFMQSWMGGNRTLKQMSKIISKKGGDVIGKVNVNWKKEEGREKRINAAASEVAAKFQEVRNET